MSASAASPRERAKLAIGAHRTPLPEGSGGWPRRALGLLARPLAAGLWVPILGLGLFILAALAPEETATDGLAQAREARAQGAFERAAERLEGLLKADGPNENARCE